MEHRGAAVVLVALVLLSSLCVSTFAFNITQILASYPNYSTLNDWLSKTGVAGEINNRTTLTILAPSNTVLSSYISGVPNAFTDPSKVGDTLRYHVLLGYFGIPELQQLPSNGTSVTTLLQTTGRANMSQGFVTLYNNGTSFLVGHQIADLYGNETILGNLTESPYVYSVLEVSAILTPVAPALPSPTPAPSPLTAKPPAAGPTGTTTVPADVPAGEAKPNGSMKNATSLLMMLVAMLLATAFASF